MTIILETERLLLSSLTESDSSFVFDLYTDQKFIKGVGDKGFKTVEDAHKYLVDNLIRHYDKHGFGLWKVTMKDNHSNVGICGLVQRQSLLYADIGFGFLTDYHRLGIGKEAAAATLEYATNKMKMQQVLAITSLDNIASQNLLGTIGLKKQAEVNMPEYNEPSVLYALYNDSVFLTDPNLS